MKRGWQWPVLVSLALAFTVGVNVVMLFAAGADPNGTVVEPDYYRKAVEWDRTMARRAASAALGWTATASIGTADARNAGAAAGAGRAVAVELRDSTSAPITDADVSVVLIHNREASTPVSVALVRREDGRYAADVPIAHGGQWEMRIVARRADQRFETSLRVEAP